ncbi:uncharacterized protein F4817DRAFT_193671 [Daldinia loculata]|uniref:uncharacterized protein n=1 Tax=Daldinia loculata TaxID=103429 RepID=UPI0020C1FA35|nr:uncharacterized protein F4817DRAFT_193671 [Daldinia loculata]KAI1645082.1 hypothetical protein F4817DRAFT_193671 [Daldinia loculata]
MCYQLVELYTACRCLYYRHAVDRCSAYGQSEHHITTRSILVGYACQTHTISPGSPKANSDFLTKETSSPAYTQNASRARSRHNRVPRSSRVNYVEDVVHQKPPPSGIQQIINRSWSDSKAHPSLTEYDKPSASSGSKEDSDDDLSSIEAFLFDDNDESSLTSLSSVGSSTALEHLTDGFLYDGYLQDLWPQVVLRSLSAAKAKEEVSSLILRYSLDLQRLARKQETSEDSTNLQIKASQFVKCKRHYLSREIYKQFWLPLSAVGQPVDENDAPENDPGVESDSDNDQQPDVDRFISLKSFLFDTEPFRIFKENVRIFVEQSSLGPLQSTWLGSMRIGFNNMITRINGKSPRPGMRRLYWTCSCGLRIYDDYAESQSGALDNLEKILSGYGARSRGSGDIESNNPPLSSKSNKGGLSNIWRSFTLDVKLPRFWLRKDYWEPGKCRRAPGTSLEQEHNYLLACVPFGRWVSKLHQQEICTILSDQDFFSLLRMLYHTNRRRLSLSWMRRVNGIDFVQFDVHRSDVAAVRSKPALPPEELKDQYQYDPMPAHLVPPVGPNMLVHFFENPTHASVLPDLYKRIPKKLRQKLTPCQVTGMSVGWGIEFVEGIDSFMFFIFGCALFLACLIVAVGWSAIKQDVQGGFGIGGFILAFMLFCGSIVHSALDSQVLK